MPLPELLDTAARNIKWSTRCKGSSAAQKKTLTDPHCSCLLAVYSATRLLDADLRQRDTTKRARSQCSKTDGKEFFS